MERSQSGGNAEGDAEPSPFAAFAMPKRNAVEEFQEQQRRAVAARRQMIGCVLASLIGTTGGATACAAYEGDWDTVLASLVGALIGSASGAVIGVVVGAICFGAISMAKMRGTNVVSDFARRDPMAAVRGLMFAWSLIGTAVGASAGAETGVKWSGAALPPQVQWTMVGSVVGGGFALVVWFVSMRKINPAIHR